MPKPCAKPLCAGSGHFDDDCPGSDDELHHCVDCGQLSWIDKGCNCERCGAYWCINYQHTFINLDCPHIETVEESICSECFLADPTLWCSDQECYCAHKRQKVQESYVKFQAAGSLCGSTILEKAQARCNVMIFRYNGQSKARMQIKGAEQGERFFNSIEAAVADAKAEIARLQAEGYALAAPLNEWHSNPSGLLE